MKERPIIMTAESIGAILDNRKTQTRRVIKPQPPQKLDLCYQAHTGPSKGAWSFTDRDASRAYEMWHCPYGQPGDLLWVRETWKPIWYLDINWTCPGGEPQENHDWCMLDPEARKLFEEDGGLDAPIAGYRADGELPELGADLEWAKVWTPSIFMPKWACRLWLRVTGVRVERVQDIGNHDAVAEGMQPRENVPYTVGHTHFEMPRKVFTEGWDSINAKRGFGWDINPFVWVVSFERAETPI